MLLRTSRLSKIIQYIIQIYNPAIPEVRQRLVDIVTDLITKYDVDGVHFDDYFYPAPPSAGQMVTDRDDYKKYGADYSTIEDFRRANVDKAIKGVYEAIVYYFSDLNEEAVVVDIADKQEVKVISQGYYCVTSINGDNVESKPSDLVMKE